MNYTDNKRTTNIKKSKVNILKKKIISIKNFIESGNPIIINIFIIINKDIFGVKLKNPFNLDNCLWFILLYKI